MATNAHLRSSKEIPPSIPPNIALKYFLRLICLLRHAHSKTIRVLMISPLFFESAYMPQEHEFTDNMLSKSWLCWDRSADIAINSIISRPYDITFGHTFQIQASLSGSALEGRTQMVLSNPGFHTQYVVAIIVEQGMLMNIAVGKE